MDTIQAILTMSDREFERTVRRMHFEHRCERRARRAFGWTHAFGEWTPGERLKVTTSPGG